MSKQGEASAKFGHGSPFDGLERKIDFAIYGCSGWWATRRDSVFFALSGVP
jgi:hypothetical protein